MFSHISVFLTVALALAASARRERYSHVRRANTTGTAQPSGECNTGSLKCCDSMYNAADVADMLNELSMPYDWSDNIAINCTPLNIYGGGQSSACQQQPICCANDYYEGFINVGCSPFDVN